MDDNRRKIVIYGLIAILVIILALILLWIFWPKAKAPQVAPPTQPEASAELIGSPSALPPASAERIEQDNSFPLGLKQLAMAFAERYGSYSSDEPVKNLRDLEPFMTSKMKSASAVSSDVDNADVFSGYSTKALSSTLAQMDGSRATVIVKTQRTQTLGASEAVKSFYQDIQLTAVKSGSDWLIDSAVWQ